MINNPRHLSPIEVPGLQGGSVMQAGRSGYAYPI